VVLGIIVLLLSLLLPVLFSVRRHADSVACAANLRTLSQAMITYANDHRGWLPGSPSTTGHALWRLSPTGEYESAGFSPSNVPPPAIELFDYVGPLAGTMRLPLPPTSSGIDRLLAYRQLGIFTCPANRGTITTRSGGAAVEDGQMLSYATGSAFMLLPARIPTTLNTSLAGRVTMPTGGSDTDPAKFNFWSSPPTYAPRIEKVGNTSRKIFLADAARRSRGSGPPQFIYDVESDYTETMFSDFGPFYGITRSYDRRAVNDPSWTGVDARPFAYRHGTSSPGRPAGAYRLNAAFFDGHVESLDDMESARPEYWLPAGSMIYRNTKLNASDSVFWPDVWQRHLSAACPCRIP